MHLFMSPRSLFICAAFSAAAASLPARAQLVLPGAAPPAPIGATVAPAAGGTKSKGAGKDGARAASPANPAEAGASAITKAPGEETIVGRQFQRHGSEGLIAFEKGPAGLTIGKLGLVGYQISKPAEFCRVEISASNIDLKPQARHQGLVSYRADLAACPFSLDVLDGAVFVYAKTCEFQQADCKVEPAGIWGPSGDSIGAAEAANIEKLRGRADKDARAGFRAVLASAHGDRTRVKEIARDQASFSSVREETCRDYSREDKHGFCASRVTLARAVALSAVQRGERSVAADGEDGEKLLSPTIEKKKPVARRKPAKAATRISAPAPSSPLNAGFAR